MKIFTRLISLLIIIAIFVSALCVNASAVSTPTIRNTGTRHVVCTALSDSANGYYTGNYTYEILSEKNDKELLTSLRTLMKDTHTGKSNYDDCRDLPTYMDCQNGDGKVVLLYSSVAVDAKEDWASDGSNGWNREHVWPQSLGGFKTSGAGADLHHVRPADAKINSTRNNNKYGNVSGGNPAPGTKLVNSMSGGTHGGGYFEPLDNVKGDVARICLYVYARYGAEITECSNITNVFQSVDVLLEWCALDPVDTWEMSRNDVIDSVQGNRNVFIDYPEYAWMIFDKELPNDMKTPSGKALAAKPNDDATEKPTSEKATSNSNSNSNSNTNTSKPTEAKKTDKNTTKEPADNGCNSSVVISSICVVGIVGIMALVKKKED